MLPGPQDDEAREHYGERYKRVARHVEEGAADIDVMCAATGEQQGGEAVHQDPDRRDDDDVAALGRRRMEQAPHRFRPDRTDRDQQEQRIDQRRQDRGLLEAVSEARARRAARHHRPGPGDDQPENVGQVVSRVRQQCHRIGGKTEYCLDHDEADVEANPDGEGSPEIGRSVGMGVRVVGHRGALAERIREVQKERGGPGRARTASLGSAHLGEGAR